MDTEGIVRRALDEDAADNDITSRATVPENMRGRASLVARDACIIAGLEPFAMAFRLLDPAAVISISVPEGARAQAGEVVATVVGDMRALLAAERTALNFVQRLSGTATLARAFVDAAPGVEIRDTRKTTPGLRALEKAAVRAGGGTSHRATLADAILIKDNHIVAAGGIETAVKAAKDTDRYVEVECDTLEQVQAAVEAGADEVLLDNMSAEMLARAVALVGGSARTEASGGVTLDTVAKIAATGVDAISVGALTHSAPAADLGLDVEHL